MVSLLDTQLKKKKAFANSMLTASHDYAREMRNGTQKDDNNMCAFCGFGPHPA
jgi:predicted molibdopterin-dependent oxidoreductase YjgC